MSIVSCVTWVRRGVAKKTPEKVQMSKDELEALLEEAQEDLENFDLEDDAASDDESEGADTPAAGGEGDKVTAGRKRKAGGGDAVTEEYGLDDYDDEEEEEKEGNPLAAIGGLAVYASNEDDPYITLKEEANSDDEDLEIGPNDNLLLAGKIDRDHCTMDVYVFNEAEGHMFTHHDAILPAFPLTIEWVGYHPVSGEEGNLAAVGSMNPTIDIWDMDVMETLEPAVSLGTKAGGKKSSKKKRRAEMAGHEEAVLSLAWNSRLRTVLASGSADHTVGLWDLSQAKLLTQLKQQEEKVQALSWHPQEVQTLLSGGADGSCIVYDCRDGEVAHRRWSLGGGEVEAAVWNHFSPYHFLAATDSGRVYCVDTRQDKPLYTISAHFKPVSCLCLSSGVPGMLVTTSRDSTIKVWDIHERPNCVLEKNLGLNELFEVRECPEAPYTFAFAGEKGVRVWDVRSSADVRSHFSGRAPVPFETLFGSQGDSTEAGDDVGGASSDPPTSGADSATTGTSSSASSVASANKNKRKKKKKAGMK